MDSKKLKKLVSSLMTGNDFTAEELISECVYNYVAERRHEIHKKIRNIIDEGNNEG